MTIKKSLKTSLITGLFFLSLGGVMLHNRIHPVSKNDFGWVPLILGFISVLIVPLLFSFKKTIHWAYLSNGFIVIIGTITMAHFALVKAPIWADLFILWPKFLMGYVLFKLTLFPLDTDTKSGGNFFRYPNFGYWLVHLAALSVVYTLGNLLWR